MDSTKTFLGVLVDRSGSMASMKTEAEAGIKQFFKEQREVTPKGHTVITSLAQFDNNYEMVWNNQPITDVPDYELHPRSMTALLDGIGRFVTETGAELDKLNEDEKPGTVIIVIVTDGQENASQEFNAKQVRELVKHQESKYNWDFVFLGANMDAVAEASKIGIGARGAMTYEATGDGMTQGYAAASAYVSRVRNGDKSSVI